MTRHGTLRRATPISFEELRPLLGAGAVCQSSTALPDEVMLSISARHAGATITITSCVPAEHADGFGGAPQLGWVVEGETAEACDAAFSFVKSACKRAGITMSE